MVKENIKNDLKELRSYNCENNSDQSSFSNGSVGYLKNEKNGTNDKNETNGINEKNKTNGRNVKNETNGRNVKNETNGINEKNETNGRNVKNETNGINEKNGRNNDSCHLDHPDLATFRRKNVQAASKIPSIFYPLRSKDPLECEEIRCTPPFDSQSDNIVSQITVNESGDILSSDSNFSLIFMDHAHDNVFKYIPSIQLQPSHNDQNPFKILAGQNKNEILTFPVSVSVELQTNSINEIGVKSTNGRNVDINVKGPIYKLKILGKSKENQTCDKTNIQNGILESDRNNLNNVHELEAESVNIDEESSNYTYKDAATISNVIALNDPSCKNCYCANFNFTYKEKEFKKTISINGKIVSHNKTDAESDCSNHNSITNGEISSNSKTEQRTNHLDNSHSCKNGEIDSINKIKTINDYLDYSSNDGDTDEEITKTDGSSSSEYSVLEPNHKNTTDVPETTNSPESSAKKRSVTDSQVDKNKTKDRLDDPEWILTSGEYDTNYTNIKQIGRGAFGCVKLGYRNSDGLLVISKFIKKSKIYKDCWTKIPETGKKICAEVYFLTKLSHPNIVKAYGYFENENYYQLIMEKWGSGMDLFEFIEKSRKVTERLASYIFRQIVSPLLYLRSLNVLHRDVKDENVIINNKFQVKLIDFGSSTYLEPGKVFSQFAGTIEYCSPEVINGHQYGGLELEIWSLGITLYTIIFGENPFNTVEQVLQQPMVIPRKYTENLNVLLKGMLDKDSIERFDLDQVSEHPWTNQHVDIDQFQFEQIVRCKPNDLDPPKYAEDLGIVPENTSNKNEPCLSTSKQTKTEVTPSEEKTQLPEDNYKISENKTDYLDKKSYLQPGPKLSSSEISSSDEKSNISTSSSSDSFCDDAIRINDSTVFASNPKHRREFSHENLKSINAEDGSRSSTSGSSSLSDETSSQKSTDEISRISSLKSSLNQGTSVDSLTSLTSDIESVSESDLQNSLSADLQNSAPDLQQTTVSDCSSSNTST